jgi:magnesium-transporting ATPase (P-type)
MCVCVRACVSSARLKEIGVRCINPKRIAISAKIRCFCFDKTGTLTKDGLDFLGAQPVQRGLHDSTPSFGTFINLLFPEGDKTNPGNTSRALAEALEVNDADPLLLIGLATCHALTMLSTTESKRLVGNEVEVKMFTATKFELFEEPGQSPVVRSPAGSVLRLDKRFEFDHGTMTMSVIITNEQSGQSYVFCKGAPERLCERCESESVPPDYQSVQAAHATAGCYVLAMGVRRLGKVDRAVIAQMSRRDAEVGLQLLGLVLFRNELKADSRQAILDLKRGDVRCVMITGDNAQCGIHIAGESGMLSPDASVALGDVDQRGEVVWSIVKGDEQLTERDRVVLRTAARSTLTNAQVLQLSSELAVTGKAFDALCNTVLDSPAINGSTTYAELLLLRTRIFARVSPSCKELIVRMHIAKGLIVGMCGDGGNDCGALRAAHVGVALSEAEASVVSPFTAATKSVRSVVDLLREGRCALATSFAGYKFLITYGEHCNAALPLRTTFDTPPVALHRPDLPSGQAVVLLLRCNHANGRLCATEGSLSLSVSLSLSLFSLLSLSD